MPKDNQWTRRDKTFVIEMVLLTLFFSMRRGPLMQATIHTLRDVFVSVFYSLAMVFIFIGLTKKTFKYNPTRVQIIKWTAGVAAFFSVSQFIHEAFLVLTHQLPHP